MTAATTGVDHDIRHPSGVRCTAHCAVGWSVGHKHRNIQKWTDILSYVAWAASF